VKTIFSKLRITTLALGLIGMFTLASCDKCKKDDDKPSEKEMLVGEWEIKSFTIDGVEVKGSIVSASKIEFEKYTGANGDFEWNINYADGSSERISGDYEVDEEDGEVEFKDQEGDIINLEYDLDKNDLELSGTIDGERYVLKAEKD
jgi:hypothetical protein